MRNSWETFEIKSRCNVHTAHTSKILNEQDASTAMQVRDDNQLQKLTALGDFDGFGLSPSMLLTALPGVDQLVLPVVRHHQLVDAWQRCQQHGGSQTETVEIPQRRQFLQLIVIPDLHGGGSILLVQDLTRVRRLETVRRDFISNVSHELRTPLASLRALTETLQDGALDDPKAAHRFIGRIQTEVDALTQMAAELLELTRFNQASCRSNLPRQPLKH